MRSGLHSRIHELRQGVARVEAWARSRYADLVRQLVRELRIFTGVNASLFLLVLLAVWKAPSSRAIQTIATLLLAATFVSAYFYLAEQNWLLTFVLADYVGWAYLAWVSVVFVFLIDVTFLRGTITQGVLGILSAPFAGP